MIFTMCTTMLKYRRTTAPHLWAGDTEAHICCEHMLELIFENFHYSEQPKTNPVHMIKMNISLYVQMPHKPRVQPPTKYEYPFGPGSNSHLGLYIVALQKFLTSSAMELTFRCLAYVDYVGQPSLWIYIILQGLQAPT